MAKKEISDAEAVASFKRSLHERDIDAADRNVVHTRAVFDPDSFRVLYDRYAERGVRYANSILHDVDESEDAVQEIFCRLLGPIAQDRVDSGRGGFGALFFGSLRNLCIDMLRKRRVRPQGMAIDALTEGAAADHVRGARGREALAEMEARVKAAFDALQTNHADALRLRVKGGLNYDEIAEALACTRSQVRTWIYRARRSLSEIFLREGLDVPGTRRDGRTRS